MGHRSPSMAYVQQGDIIDLRGADVITGRGGVKNVRALIRSDNGNTYITLFSENLGYTIARIVSIDRLRVNPYKTRSGIWVYSTMAQVTLEDAEGEEPTRKAENVRLTKTVYSNKAENLNVPEFGFGGVRDGEEEKDG